LVGNGTSSDECRDVDDEVVQILISATPHILNVSMDLNFAV
jgi:hypothetical protein